MKSVENSYALASSVRDLNCRGIHLRWSFSLSLFDQRGSSAESGLSNLAMQETNEPKTSIWKQPLKGWRGLAGWAVVIVILATVTRILLGLTTDKSSGGPTSLPWSISIGITLAAVILIGLLVRCFSSWRNFKRLLLGLACLAGLIALFYAEEDVRGRLAWGQLKARWEAKGEKFDFAAFIPPPVPDERNFAMTPVVATTYGQILDRNGHQLSPQNTNVVNRLQMPLDSGDGGPTNGIGNWQKGHKTRPAKPDRASLCADPSFPVNSSF